MRVFHFMRHKLWFLGSITVVTVFAVIAIFAIGLDFGIDFKGGVRMEFSLQKAASVDDIREVVSEAGFFEPVVQSVEATAGGSAFMVTAQQVSDAAPTDTTVASLTTTTAALTATTAAPANTAAEQSGTTLAAAASTVTTVGQTEAQLTAQTKVRIQAVKDVLTSRYGLNTESWSEEQVGASFGANTTKMALIGVAIAVLLIIAYLSWRFELKFAIPAILALVHDVGLTLGIYAASQRLVTSATVAAILTILGYSVHDTIIVYDRMRENTLLMKKETYGDMVDLSIRQTMIRSINTTVALLLPLVAILIFGGPTLKDFAMALTIGVVAGTYSSFFVAAPLVTIWKEREPMYRKRLATAKAEGSSGVGSDTLAGFGVSGPATKITGVTPSAKPGQSGAASNATKAGSSKGRPAGKKGNRTSR